MISEVVNALFVTWVATEYLLSPEEGGGRGSRSSRDDADADAGEGAHRRPRTLRSFAQQRPLLLVLLLTVVLVINLFDQVTGIGFLFNHVLSRFLHVPKVLLAAILYVAALYVDCNRGAKRERKMKFATEFLPLVLRAFCYVLPIYPLAAVAISFLFLFVISLFEAMRWNEQVLNWPIYYGTLYGPFSYIYLTVKRQVLRERNTLPLSATNGHVLGSAA